MGDDGLVQVAVRVLTAVVALGRPGAHQAGGGTRRASRSSGGGGGAAAAAVLLMRARVGVLVPGLVLVPVAPVPPLRSVPEANLPLPGNVGALLEMKWVRLAPRLELELASASAVRTMVRALLAPGGSLLLLVAAVRAVVVAVVFLVALAEDGERRR